MIDRLAPDMHAFIYQVQSACDYVKAAAAWLSAQTPPKHEDNEQTIGEVRARIRKTVAFAESVKEEQYAGASERKIPHSWAPGKVIGGEDYLLQIAIPKSFFTSRRPTPSSAATASMSARRTFVWIYVDTSKQVGDPDHLKVFGNADAANTWFKEHEPEGVAFEYPVIGATWVDQRRPRA